jgi:ATP-dependent helicase/nuclease subunit B
MIAIKRIFLGLDRPGLSAAAEYLKGKYGAGQSLDLSRVLVVVPGRRAGRRMLELLADDASRHGVMMTPPLIETVGRVAEHLYSPRRPFASDLTQRLTWSQVLRRADDATLAPLLPQRPLGEAARWDELGALLRRQHIELAADGLSFQDVADDVESIGGRDESLRWDALARLQASYHETLDQLALWDRQTARLKAIEFDECATTRDLILVGTVDMNVALRQMLDRVADKVTSLVFAPAEWDERFDGYGCLLPDVWQDLKLELRDEQIEVVDGPSDQAAAVVRRLGSFGDRYQADEITIGVPDERMVSEVGRQLARADVRSRWGPGVPLRGSNPFRLLDGVRDFVANRRFIDIAGLVRHPDTENWLRSTGLDGDWLTELDRYQAEHLPYHLPKQWLGSPKRIATIRTACNQVTEWLDPLFDRKLPLAEWKSVLTELLLQVYGHRQFDRTVDEDRLTLRCCRRVVDVLDELASVPAPLSPTVSAEESIHMVLDLVGRDRLEAESSDAIELLGWLELPLDDAPALVVTNFNEGYVPESVNSDLFLPNQLRSKLGLLDNPRRYARDAYALQVLAQTRESLHLIVGRRTLEGDPLTPSRLLFATSREQTARRAQRIFADVIDPIGRGPNSFEPLQRKAALPVPMPEPLPQPITEIRITSFRDYLACPYRFYLRHVAGLASLDDHAIELDGAAFGTMAHEVLRRFGESSSRESREPAEIRKVLDRELARYVGRLFGEEVRPAVQVQVEQLRLRLSAFAERQAAWAAEGWQIEHIEFGVGESVEFEVDGTPILLRGRIDRIDVHSESGRRLIIDYKTGDAPSNPSQTHLRNGRWIDLQLPLYRHVARTLSIAGPFDYAYALLPRDTGRVEFALANWSESQLEAADDEARDVVRRIRREEFWPPADPPPDFSDQFAGICQDDVI